jgi:trimeric autotransporter adhesin
MRKLILVTIPLLVILLATCRKSSTNEDVDNGKDSIAYTGTGDTIYVNYSGSSVTVIKPTSFDAISVTFSGGDVIINSQVSDKVVYYCLQGTATNGMFKIYSNYQFQLILNGVNMTNNDGPAINNQSGKKCAVKINAGTVNSLTDGSSYATSSEDQKSTFFSEGPVEFDGSGSLTIKGLMKHAICSDDHIDILNGAITISGALKDGIHVNDYFKMDGGSLNVSATDDGIECEGGYILISGGAITTVNASADVKAIRCDSTMVISGGTINMTVSGAQSKGLKSGKNMLLSGGTITINASGAAVLGASGSGYDPSYCTGIKCDSSIVISGANITITSTGTGGKGISSDKNVTMTGGTVKISTSGAGATYKNSSGATDSYNATCITADGNINILGGSVTTSSSGSGGKGLSADGAITLGESGNSPSITITTTGAKFLVSGTDYSHPKAIKSTGAININNGDIVISSADDGIHSEASITQVGGNITISKSYEGVESKTISIKGGTLSVTASNDGINATAGTTSGGTESNDGSLLAVSGGIISVVVSSGDGFDSNGSITMSGGTAIIQGPPSSPEVGIDYNGTFSITGGLLIATGPNSGSNMIQTATSASQYCVKFTPSSGQSLLSASTLFHMEDANKTNIVTFQPLQSIYYIVFSSPVLASSTSYSIYTGGSSTGTNTNGLYTGGTYTAGTLKKTFTVSSFLSSVSL